MNRMLDRVECGAARQRQFSADASHELRSPLSTIRAAAEMIGRAPTGPRTSSLADDITAEADRMDELIGGLLSLSRMDESRFGMESNPLDLADLVRREVRDMRRDSIEVRAPDAVLVDGNANLLRQVVRNLIDDADRHADHRVVVSLARDVDEVELSVEDDGRGIAELDRERIFDRFVRLGEARGRDVGGFGLGLAVVRSIVDRHAGTIFANRSEELGGAQLVVRLPASREISAP